MTPDEAKRVMEPILLRTRNECPGWTPLALSMTWVAGPEHAELVVALSIDVEADVEGLCAVLGAIAGQLPARAAADAAAQESRN